MEGVREPALVLTPPSQHSANDDGLLTMEDVMGFELLANDWVILSACNTAAPDGSGEGLSGLTRAFFYAGAPAVLVSQWSVDDAATQRLMTLAFAGYKSNQLQHPVLLQNGMVELMAQGTSDSTHAYFAHPFAWASFVVIGASAP